MSELLAMEGGSKAVPGKLPNFQSAAGRTFGVEEETLVLQALRSGCLSRNGGTMVKALERDFAAALGVKKAVACSSGTSCVHLAVAALDLEPGDEVIVPPITDIGSILPILWQNAIPVFADVNPLTFVLDPAEVEISLPRHIAALTDPSQQTRRRALEQIKVGRPRMAHGACQRLLQGTVTVQADAHGRPSTLRISALVFKDAQDCNAWCVRHLRGEEDEKVCMFIPM